MLIEYNTVYSGIDCILNMPCRNLPKVRTLVSTTVDVLVFLLSPV